MPGGRTDDTGPKRIKSDSEYWDTAIESVGNKLKSIQLRNNRSGRRQVRIPGPRRTTRTNPNVRGGGIRIRDKRKININLIREEEQRRLQEINDALHTWDFSDVWDSRKE